MSAGDALVALWVLAGLALTAAIYVHQFFRGDLKRRDDVWEDER